MPPNSANHRFEYKGWRVVIGLDGTTLDETVSGHADLQWEGLHRCRLALAGPFPDGASAIKVLADKARTFIDEWPEQDSGGAAALSSIPDSHAP